MISRSWPLASWLLHADNPAHVERAAKLLLQGGLVAFPTETVFGIGAVATDAQALERLYAAKGRGMGQPSTLLCADAAQALALFESVTSACERLSTLWPGPLTLIGARARNAPLGVSGDGRTIGARVPNHDVALALLRATARLIAAPSANRAGLPPAQNAAEVRALFGGKVAAVLDGGAVGLGTASTIVDVSQDSPRLVREGAISHAEIERIVGAKVARRGA